MDGCKARKVGRAKKSRTQELGLEWGEREKRKQRERERGIENEREKKEEERNESKKLLIRIY